jgi:hypothetical protein
LANHPAMTRTTLDGTLETIRTRAYRNEFDDAFLALFHLGVVLRVIEGQSGVFRLVRRLS